MTIDNEFIVAMKEKLLNEKKRLQNDVDLLSHSTDVEDHEVVVENIGNEEGDSLVETEQYIDAIGVENTLESELRAIDDALGRIDEGVYGSCIVCGNEMSKDRLEALPFAKSCVQHGE